MDHKMAQDEHRYAEEQVVEKWTGEKVNQVQEVEVAVEHVEKQRESETRIVEESHQEKPVAEQKVEQPPKVHVESEDSELNENLLQEQKSD